MSSKNKGKLWIHAWEPEFFYTKCKFCDVEIKLIPATNRVGNDLYVKWQVIDIQGKHNCRNKNNDNKVKPTW